MQRKQCNGSTEVDGLFENQCLKSKDVLSEFGPKKQREKGEDQKIFIGKLLHIILLLTQTFLNLTVASLPNSISPSVYKSSFLSTLQMFIHHICSFVRQRASRHSVSALNAVRSKYSPSST